MNKFLTLGVVTLTVLAMTGVAAFVPVASAATLAAGDLIKASGPAVYYYAADGKRYTFPTESTYNTWYSGFSGVKTITDDELSVISLAGNVAVRPGTKLIKIQTVPKVFAVQPNAKLVWVKDEATAVKLYGADWNKKIVIIPDGFWVNYTDTGLSLDGTAYPAGQLIKFAGSSDVYYVNADGTKSKVATDSAFTANSWKWSDVVTAPATMTLSAGADITGIVSTYVDASQGGGAGTTGTTVVSGTLNAALDSGTPGNTNIPTNATAAAANVVFTKVKFTTGSAAATITGMKVTRTGLSQDAAISSIKLFDGSLQVGNSQSLNSVHQASFSNISIAVPANSSKVVTIAATMTASAAYDGNIIALGIAAASDVTTTASVGGTFPITGNTMTVNTGITIGTATLYNGNLGDRNATDLTVDTDVKDVRFTQVKITAGSAEDIVIKQITAVKNGTASNTDITNIRLVNDTTSKTLGTASALNSNGRVIFDINETVGKGKSVELSILGDMAGTGSGRTIAFDLHDGTAYTIMVEGASYGFGITPTRSNFCAAAGTCTAQTINQGYVTGSLSASTPATGYVAVGATDVSLLTYELTAAGEAINVSSSQIKITTATAELSQVTHVGIYDASGKLVAGPQDCTTASAGNQTLTFTDAYTVPVGTTKYTVKANMATDMSANDTIVAAVPATSITAKGASSGKTTYTTSSGSTVAPAAIITGKTQTIKGPTLSTITAATPVATVFIVNAQDIDLAYFDLDATAGGEDIKVSSLIVTNQGSGTVTDINNWELWGDSDNTNADATIARLETTTATATGAATNTFTFKSPLRVSKSKISRVTLRADVATRTDGNTHQFYITTSGATATGWTTGNTATKTYSGAGQAHTIGSAGTLKVSVGADRPAAAQYVAGTTGNTMMTYKFQSTNESVDVTDFYVATTGSTANGDIASVKLYVDGTLIGSTSGYSLDAGGDAHIVLDSGTFVVPKSPSYSTLAIKVELAASANLTDVATLEIGLGAGASYNDAEWGANGAESTANSCTGGASDNFCYYYMTATGKSSGTALTTSTINSTGVNSTGTVAASYVEYLYDGVLVVSLNSASPSGSATPGANKEVLRLDLAAVGDDITVDEMEFCIGGTSSSVTGSGDVTLKSADLGTTYATMTKTEFETYWDDYGGNGANDGTFYPMDTTAPATGVTPCFSFGVSGATGVDEASGTEDSTTLTTDLFDVTITVAAGTTKTVRLFGDTTGAGASANQTLQVSLSANGASAAIATAAGLTWSNSGGTVVNSALTKNLPVNGGSLVY